ncbi:MAG TPA: CBS domain-containing protein [Pyrodictium delaneyi]|uniref:CBS domain-containing protein n=1 Tax=Pyrodictium delaneyi TaxID=1273541 RepID=A0A832ZTB4_9CREN|nr:CBS domain-containing protein [Pyrodictium delaneyi]
MVLGLNTRIVDIFSPRYPYVLPDTSFGELRRIVREQRIRMIPVVTDERTMKLLGIIRRGALLLATGTKVEITAKDLLEDPVATLLPSASIVEAARQMLRADEWYAPVTDEERRLLGVLGLEDIIRYILEKHIDMIERPVSDVMETKIVYVEPDTPIYKVWQMMLSRRLAALPVIRNGKIIGVIAEHDLITHGFTRPDLESSPGHRRGPTVGEVMSTPAVTIEPDTPLSEAARLIVERDIGRVYVADDSGILQGVVDRSDVVAAWLKAIGIRPF